ncbi:MAG: preprotein translocase subunit YajC [Methylophilus sp.]|nr:preprotein translocase subunit YajC [Methylophilus sp.]
MKLTEIGPLWITLIASLVIAVVLLGIRVFVMQRVQQKRQRENRQETERLKSLVAAYRALAGSFSPAVEEHNSLIEETLADIVLFGSIEQVTLAAKCVNHLKANEHVDYQPLIHSLRRDLRLQLGLEAIPAYLLLPPSGPSRNTKNGRGEGEGGKGADARAGAGQAAGGGGGGAGGAAMGGVGAGIIASEASAER